MRPFLTLHDPARAKTYYDQELWRSDTFYSLMARHAVERSDATALRDCYRELSWGQLKAEVDAVAGELESQGLVKGDRVSLWCSNRVDVVIAFLACSRQGYACNPSLHNTYTCGEIVELLQRLKAAVIVTEPDWGTDRNSCNFPEMLSQVSTLKRPYMLDELLASSATPTSPPNQDPDSVAYLAFTSGTMGMPKCVMHSSNSLLTNARDLVNDWKLGPDKRLLTLSPLSHHIAWVAAGQWLVSGCQLITGDPPANLSRFDWIVESGATYVMGVPTHAMDILDEQRSKNIQRMGKVETFYMAGSPIPPVVAEALVKQDIKPQNVYGMTENSSHQYTYPDDDPDTWISTCGRGGPSYEVRIFDPENEDEEVKPGETGQIGGRGAALMLGYYSNQEATESSFNKDGWFLSGDLGSMDENGNLRIEGRLKDLIIRGGHNIYPSQIEALALRHGAVDKVAAFPVADGRLGEKVCLAVIGAVPPNEMLDHLNNEGLSKYDMPEYYINMDTFPLTASGKILKRNLIEMVSKGELTPASIRFKSS